MGSALANAQNAPGVPPAPSPTETTETSAPTRGPPPLVHHVVLEGNTKISTKDLKKVMDVEPLEPVDPKKLQQNAEKLRLLYVEKGFYRTTVSWELRPAPVRSSRTKKEEPGFFEVAASTAWDYLARPFFGGDDDEEVIVPRGRTAADVVYRVDEGIRVKVRGIEIVGNKNVQLHELESVLRTKESVPLADLLGMGLYREEVLGADLRAIGTLYENRGFLDVKVGPPEVDLAPDQSTVRLRIPVQEGPQYFLGDITIDGDLVVDDAAESEERDGVLFEKRSLRTRFGIEEGGVASRAGIATGMQGIAKRYHDRGYAYANVSPETKLHAGTRRIDLAIHIDSGPRVRVERVLIEGNDKTQDHVIRRELRLYEGEWFSAEQLLRSEARVRALGYFEQVRVMTDQGTSPERLVVTIRVKEKNTGVFQLGAGYSTGEGFVFNGQIAYDNFLGLGQRMSAATQLSGPRKLFDLRFSEPYLFFLGQDPLSFSVRGFNNQVGFGDFTRTATGGQLVLGYPIGSPFSGLTNSLAEDAPRWARPYVPDLENLRVFLAANAERVLIQSPDLGYLPGLDNTRPRYTTALEAGVIFDQRNNRLFPTAGYFLEARAEVANPAFGGALLPDAEASVKKALSGMGWPEGAQALDAAATVNNYQRFSLNGRFYLTFDEFLPIRGIVAKANVELGYLRSDDLLPFENYYLGGIGSVRGYFPRSIAPTVEVDTPDGKRTYRVGGDKQLFANVELEFPLVQQLGIRGVVFFDAGNVFGRDESFFYLGDNVSSGADDSWDPRRDLPFGMFASVGFGVRWFSPIGPLRFEWGIPLSRRPAGTPGMSRGDQPVLFEFGMGGSF